MYRRLLYVPLCTFAERDGESDPPVLPCVGTLQYRYCCTVDKTHVLSHALPVVRMPSLCVYLTLCIIFPVVLSIIIPKSNRMHCLFIISEMEVVAGKEKEGCPVKMENGVRRKVLSADEEALCARSWTVNSMEGAVTRAKDLFLRYYITPVDLLLLSIPSLCCHASLIAFNSALFLSLCFLCMLNGTSLPSLH